VYVAEHPDLATSPAMALAAATALSDAGIGVDDVAHFDLYSCFPASLGFARDVLGLSPDDARPLTVTGGLPYAGGPGSGYMLGALATMAGVLRADPGSFGLVSGVGMHMTKHVHALYSSSPPDGRPFPGLHDLGGPVGGARQIVTGPEVEARRATVATYSVVHGRDGAAEHGVVVADVGEGRAYAVVTDPGWLQAAEAEELVGSGVVLRVDPRGYTTAYPR
jgi:acetyl-CoA C-acetyltransferase